MSAETRKYRLTTRIAEINDEIGALGMVVKIIRGRPAFDARCALEDAGIERAECLRELSILQEERSC